MCATRRRLRGSEGLLQAGVELRGELSKLDEQQLGLISFDRKLCGNSEGLGPLPRHLGGHGYSLGLGDAAPIGLILCTEKGPEQVALLGLDSGEVRVARYIVDEVRSGLERIAARAGELEK